MDSIPYFDAHCDTVSRCAREGLSLRQNRAQLDLSRLSAFRGAAQVFAIFCDADTNPPGGMFAECRRQRLWFEQAMADNADLAVPCATAAEVRRANEQGKIAALLSCEGAELLDCDPEKLDWAKAAGVRMVNLTWNHANPLCGSHRDEPERGLSGRGRDFVRRAGELGIRVDVSHCSDAAFWDLAELSHAPVAASHSNARALCPHSRNLTDDMFRAIAETGGFVGLNLYAPFVVSGGEASMDALLDHVEHFLRLGGEKTLGLGGDLDGCDRLAGGMDGVQDVPLLWQALRNRGYGEELLEDLFYNNLLRFLEE